MQESWRTQFQNLNEPILPSAELLQNHPAAHGGYQAANMAAPLSTKKRWQWQLAPV